jgi:hypothetical protein
VAYPISGSINPVCLKVTRPLFGCVASLCLGSAQALFKGIQLFVHEAKDPRRDAPQGIGKGILALSGEATESYGPWPFFYQL